MLPPTLPQLPYVCFARPHQAEFEVRGQGVQASVRNSYRFFMTAYRLFPPFPASHHEMFFAGGGNVSAENQDSKR
jgi:hypothetical protein